MGVHDLGEPVPELSALSVKNDQVVCRYCFELLVINAPTALLFWARTPRSEVGVRSSKLVVKVGSSSLATS